MGKKCKNSGFLPMSCWVVVSFSRTMFHQIKALVLLFFAVEKSVPSPACGWAFIGEVTLMSMQALFYQLNQPASNNSLKSHVARFCFLCT